MSEYQYYEFQAIDRSLTKDEMAELRALTTRATITPTRLQNVYHWGNFKGDPLTLMERYFDAFVYVTNWGTRELMLRLPRRALDPAAVEPYCLDDSLNMHLKDDHVILDFLSRDEEGGGWVDDEEAEDWMSSLIPLRADLASGDLRALYIAWLSGIQWHGLEDEEDESLDGENAGGLEDERTYQEIEPPVPPGLANLSASLEALVDFLQVDEDLLAVAAERSAELKETDLRPAELERWIRELSEADKDGWLLRLLRGDEPHLREEILVQYRRANSPEAVFTPGRRKMSELLRSAGRLTEAREREESERQARAREWRLREEAARRAAHLDSLAGQEDDLWRQIEMLVERKRPAEYDQAVQLLTDLRDLSARGGSAQSFEDRLSELRLRHAKKPSFLARLEQAGLLPK